MRDIFIADAHLLDPTDENYRLLLVFLEAQRGQVRNLFLMGDIFEFWVGYRHAVFAPYVPILEALRQMREAGAQIIYVEGNHDFHMGPYFEQTLSCQVLPDGGAFQIDGRRIYIAHGDLVNPQDKGYRLLRRVLRSAPLRWLMALLPPDWTWGIARWASSLSNKSHATKQERWVPRQMLLAHAKERFDEGYSAVVTGHFHAPLHEVKGQGTILALGDWIDQYSYGVYEDGKFWLESYKP